MARTLTLLTALTAAALTAPALAQSTSRAVFVGNNGNIDGSVTSLRIEADGSLTFVDRLVTGLDDDPGTNPQCIDLSPDGRWLATGHGTSNDVLEQLTIIAVAADATLTEHAVFSTPNSPLDLKWLDDTHLAVTQTDLAGLNQVLVYKFVASAPSLTLVDFEATGSFNSYLAVSRAGSRLFAQDSTGNTIYAFQIDALGTLDLLDSISTNADYPLGIGTNRLGTVVYGGGGISNGGHSITGAFCAPATGQLTLVPGVPFISPGQSPKQVELARDDTIALVAHGTDATVRTFFADKESGLLTYSGTTFDVGFQGSLGVIATLGDLAFFTDRDTIFDGVRGVYSFTVNADGTLTQNGGLVDTQGVAPNDLVVWGGAGCAADTTGPGGVPDGNVDALDFLELIGQWGSPCAGSCTSDTTGPAGVPDGNVDALDYLLLIAQWGSPGNCL